MQLIVFFLNTHVLKELFGKLIMRQGVKMEQEKLQF